MSGNRNLIVKSILWKLTERTSVQIVIFIVTIILARLISPQEYGLIAIVLVFISIANVIVDGGLNSALIQKKDADQVDFSTIFYSSLMLSLFLIILLYFSAPFIAIFYDKEELTLIIRVLSISLLFYAANSIQRAYISRHLLFKQLFICSIVTAVITGTVCIVMAWNGYGVWALVTQTILSQVTTTIVMFITVKWYPTLVFSVKRFKTLFNFGWKIFLTNFIISIFNNIRSLIIGKVYSPSALAYFERGKQFPTLIIDNINASVQAVLFPVFSNNQENKEAILNMVRRSVKVNSYILFPIMTGLIVLAKPLILCLLTNMWSDAIPFVRIFGIALILLPIQIANLEAVKSLGYSNVTLKLEVFKKIIEVVILVITIPLGVKAIAWGMVVYNLISLFINLKPTKDLLGYSVSEQIHDILPYFALSGAMALCVSVVYLIFDSAMPQLVFGILVGIVSYVLISILTKNESYEYVLGMILKNKENKA